MLVAEGDGLDVAVDVSVAVGVPEAVGVSSTGVAVTSKVSRIQPSAPLLNTYTCIHLLPLSSSSKSPSSSTRSPLRR